MPPNPPEYQRWREGRAVNAWGAATGPRRKVGRGKPCPFCGHHLGDHAATGCVPTPAAIIEAARGGPVPDPMPEPEECGCVIVYSFSPGT